VTDADEKVMEQSSAGEGILRNGTAEDGKALRVLTVSLPLTDQRTQSRADAVLIAAVPLDSTQSTLNDLALLLLLASGIGVVGAGAAGLAVARAGLRPVDKLTEAVEHVARTEDLNIRIPVDDDSEDEIARLSHSFNSMTSSLAS
ncbi:HAMP domain-containing protein, partial [Streptomyces sp. TRM76130]|nr:HAMP domain-containing protein [Streptomyces sp. TRM76130]